MIGEQSLEVLLERVVSTIQEAFHPDWVAVLLPQGDSLAVAATAGHGLSSDELAQLRPLPGRREHLGTAPSPTATSKIALTARGRPVGLIALSGRVLIPTTVNCSVSTPTRPALAIERSQLRRQALRTELLEEVDHWRGALMGAVSHDLRTPLASVKAAVSTLRRSGTPLSPRGSGGPARTDRDPIGQSRPIGGQPFGHDRIESGALEVRRSPVVVADIVEEAGFERWPRASPPTGCGLRCPMTFHRSMWTPSS